MCTFSLLYICICLSRKYTIANYRENRKDATLLKFMKYLPNDGAAPASACACGMVLLQYE